MRAPATQTSQVTLAFTSGIPSSSSSSSSQSAAEAREANGQASPRLERLVVLKIGGAYRLSDDGLQALVKAAPSIRELSLTHVRRRAVFSETQQPSQVKPSLALHICIIACAWAGLAPDGRWAQHVPPAPLTDSAHSGAGRMRRFSRKYAGGSLQGLLAEPFHSIHSVYVFFF